jgi:hypothetical protein
MADFIAVRCLACCPQTLGAQLAKSRGDLRRKTRSSRADAHGKTVPLTGPVSAPGRMSAPTASATGAWPPPMCGAQRKRPLISGPFRSITATRAGCRSAVVRVRRQSTQRRRWRFSQPATGLPRNLTFAHADEKVSDSDSSRSQVASIDRERVLAERLHPKAAYSRCRPKGAAGTFQVDRPVHSVNGRSPIASRNRRPATAVIRRWRPPTGTPSRLNDCI